ncbi:CheR family methyltransferase (plasmid) [Tundrisphaera lichenicola]|uniref:CheR family methyltransferase n=1 Tax=Tundrisphaera lichenicola TaxID=2029860 RepID=UPI003EB989E2
MVEHLLSGRIGLDPSIVGEGLIKRGVLARMASLGLRDRSEYERVLAGSAEELQSLIEEVVIPESWFFRDARPFEVFRDHARSGWLARPSRPPLMILSLPCAGGEEAYSIAITLLEIGLPPDRFRVDAVDVSARSVARAIAGVYGPNSFRGVDPTIRSRYFREHGGASTLDPSVRSTVRFHLGNLLDPGLLADRPPFDVVFCRNLLIYFDGPSRAIAYTSLARLLVEGGVLFLGHADRADDSPVSPFSMIAEKGGFAYRKGPPRARVDPVKPAISTSSIGKKPDRRPDPPVRTSTGRPTTLSPAQSQREAKAVPVVKSAPTLELALKLADEGRYDEASRVVERAILEVGPSARAFALLGMIRQAAGDRDRAEESFLKAVYLDGQDDESLLALALLARRRGDVAAEAVYRRRLERVRSRKEKP